MTESPSGWDVGPLAATLRSMARPRPTDFDSDTTLEARQLQALLASVEHTHLHVRRLGECRHAQLWGGDVAALLNDFVAAVGLGNPGVPVTRWNPVDKPQAHAILRDTLRWEQAYETPRLELIQAERIAASFVCLFDEWGSFFTNASFDERPTGLRATSWYGSVTLATFEAGIVGVDGQRIGLLYVADED